MYKNGLMIKRGPFRPAGSETFNSFIRDIFDGYFPDEFRESSPDGVLLEVTDKRLEYFKDDTSTESSNRQGEMKANQLLDRLPKTVIKGGDIVSVRDDISSKLNGEEKSSDSVQLPKKTEPSNHIQSGKQVIHLPTRAKLMIQNDADSVDDVITSIQVKWHDGKYVFILKMFGNDLVNDIKEAIIDYFNDEKSYKRMDIPDFKVRCAYPPRDLLEDITLSEAKLVPNATLHSKLTC